MHLLPGCWSWIHIENVCSSQHQSRRVELTVNGNNFHVCEYNKKTLYIEFNNNNNNNSSSNSFLIVVNINLFNIVIYC